MVTKNTIHIGNKTEALRDRSVHFTKGGLFICFHLLSQIEIKILRIKMIKKIYIYIENGQKINFFPLGSHGFHKTIL